MPKLFDTYNIMCVVSGHHTWLCTNTCLPQPWLGRHRSDLHPCVHVCVCMCVCMCAHMCACVPNTLYHYSETINNLGDSNFINYAVFPWVIIGQCHSHQRFWSLTLRQWPWTCIPQSQACLDQICQAVLGTKLGKTFFCKVNVSSTARKALPCEGKMCNVWVKVELTFDLGKVTSNSKLSVGQQPSWQVFMAADIHNWHT